MPGADGRFAIERYVTHGAPRTAERGTDLFAGPGGAGGTPAAGFPARG
jgi:hypothetical protein